MVLTRRVKDGRLRRRLFNALCLLSLVLAVVGGGAVGAERVLGGGCGDDHVDRRSVRGTHVAPRRLGSSFDRDHVLTGARPYLRVWGCKRRRRLAPANLSGRQAGLFRIRPELDH